MRARATVHHSLADRMRSTDATERIYPPGQYAKILAAENCPATARAAAALGISEGDTAVRRHRVTFNEDGPVSSSTSWFARELGEQVPALLVPERIIGGTPKAIEEATGLAWEDGQDLVGAKIATTEEADLLALTERPAALLVGYNTLFTADGTVVEYGEYLTHGDRLTSYSYHRARD